MKILTAFAVTLLLRSLSVVVQVFLIGKIFEMVENFCKISSTHDCSCLGFGFEAPPRIRASFNGFSFN